MANDKTIKIAGCTYHLVDKSSPEEVERDKGATEFFARYRQSFEDDKIRAEQQHRTLGYEISSSGTYNGWTNAFQARDYQSMDNSLQTSCAATTESEKTIDVIEDFLVEGEVSSMFGSPGIGKGQVTCMLAALVTQGITQIYSPDPAQTAPGIVLFHSTEDDFKRVILPRCEAAGANPNLIHSVDGISNFSSDIKSFIYSAESEKSIIAWAERKEAEGKGRVRLIVFDPGLLVLGSAASTYRNVQEAIARVSSLAKRLRCAILLVLHDTKSAKGKPLLDRAVGNRAIVGGPRCVMMISGIVNGPTEYGGERVLVRAKSNLGKIDGGYEFGFQTVILESKNGPIETSKIVIKRYHPESPTDIISRAESGELAGSGKINQLDAAINIIKDILRNGHVLSKEFNRLVAKAGITTRDRDAAKDVLGLVNFKLKGAGKNSPWAWCLPDAEQGKS